MLRQIWKPLKSMWKKVPYKRTSIIGICLGTLALVGLEIATEVSVKAIANAVTARLFGPNFSTGLQAYNSGDYKTAREEFKLLADSGNAEAQLYLGHIYNQGLGVAQDYVEAFRLYKEAEAQDNAEAQYNLGVMYQNGWGVNQDPGRAIELYDLSAKAGIVEAQYSLGVMYENGWGVSWNYVTAHAWYNIAGANGHEGARDARDNLAKTGGRHLPPDQRTEAQRLAKRCLESEYKNCP